MDKQARNDETQFEITADTATDVDDTDTDTDEEWTPPTKDQWDELLAKKSKADAEAASRKRWLRDAGINPKTGEKLTVDAHTEEASTAVKETRDYSQDIKRSESAGLKKGVAIYAELLNAGVNPKRVDAVMKFLDVSEMSFDDDGIEGLSDQIADLKEDYPEFFKRERMKTSDASVVGAGRKTASGATETKTWQDDIRDRFNKGLL